MQKLMDRVFTRYGTEAILHIAGGKQSVQVFFESVNSKSWQNMEARHHVLGKLPKGQYICRFPAKTAVNIGDWVQLDERSYSVCRVEDMLGPGGCAYRWALCTRKGGADTWG